MTVKAGGSRMTRRSLLGGMFGLITALGVQLSKVRSFGFWEDEAIPEWVNFTGMETIDDSPSGFRKMLTTMGDVDRAILAQSLRMLPSIERGDFGKYGLRRFETYADNERPRSFNEVEPQVVVAAVAAKRIPADLISADSIIRQFIWVSSSIFTYWFKPRDVNYHSVVQWAARKFKVSAKDCNNLSTFRLERRILEQVFAEIWDNLTIEQRTALLREIERSTGTQFTDVAGIAALTGAGALAALGATVAFSGFAFYTTMSVVICTVAGFFGMTLPFVVYTTASSTVALLAGPIGWALAGVLAAIGVVLLGAANPRKTAAFITTLHMRKAHYFHLAGLELTPGVGENP